MVERKHGSETHDEKIRRRMQVVYARQTREKQIFMDDLKEYRRIKDKQMLQSIVVAVGPRWYQALSVPQRVALDSLKDSIYQDILEGRPERSSVIMHKLGLVPRPSTTELMNCLYAGRNDPKEMLAQLYLSTYGYPIEGKRTSYCLNARLMLSAIFYLGLDNLLVLLQKTFAPDEPKPKPPPKPKPKPKIPPPSPYLVPMVATLYEPPQIRRKSPLPLPDLSDLNEPYEEEPIIQKPPPPPPPPPPPKKRLPISYCDQLAGIEEIKPQVSTATNSNKEKKSPRNLLRKLKSSKSSLMDTSKLKSLNLDNANQIPKKKGRRRKLVAPTTGLRNVQYMINGVYRVHGKTCYVLGSVTLLPSEGDLIHGGYRAVNGEYITIHCGFRGRPPARKSIPCDCLKEWNDSVFQYIKDHKCYCGHYYDFRNEDTTFPPDQLPYFNKPTRHGPLSFNYDRIFDLDDKRLYIESEFKKAWDTDSILHEDDGTTPAITDKKKKKKKPADNSGTSKRNRSQSANNNASGTCLGQNPKPQDYLKCALRHMRQMNVAARLPDLHLVPELKEWMRQRLYGDLTPEEKREYLRKSTTYWRMFTTLSGKGFGHVATPKEPMFRGHTTWYHKQNLNDKFRHFTHRYKLSMFRSHAYVTNLLWRSMYQAEFPDKNFREIYFSYLYSRIEDLQLIHPYCARETEERKVIMRRKRYICLPDGYEPKTS
uniref:SFRICE_020087 n=1 Tax=Spodoptera frugiperda TaxID=7108 RepID=A0A2H1WTC7_SPOFR